MKSATLAEGREIDEIRSFVTSKEWYLRNAALVALNKVDPDMAQSEAIKMLADKALVVRSAAVEIIGQNLSDKNKEILFGEMAKGYNFNRTSSLWIRKQILEKLAQSATEKDQPIFAKMLFDNDKKISELSANTLERITGKKLSRKKFVQNWREYAKQENWN
jgi:HEAT repeat protein